MSWSIILLLSLFVGLSLKWFSQLFPKEIGMLRDWSGVWLSSWDYCRRCFCLPRDLCCIVLRVMLVTEVAFGFVGSIVLGHGVIFLVWEIQWLFCVEEVWEPVVGGWSGFRIDRGLAFVAGFPLRIFLFAVGFSELRASSANQLLRVIDGSYFWHGWWIGLRQSSWEHRWWMGLRVWLGDWIVVGGLGSFQVVAVIWR